MNSKKNAYDSEHSTNYKEIGGENEYGGQEGGDGKGLLLSMVKYSIR